MTQKLFLILSVFLVSFVIGIVYSQEVQSPCPGLFQYASDGVENYGLIYFSGARIGQAYLLDLQMTVPGRLPTTFYGEISLIEGKAATLQNIIQNKTVIYKVTFPVQNQLPEVTSIRINNNLICSGRSKITGSVTKLSLQHTLQTSGQIPLTYQPSQTYSQQSTSIQQNPSPSISQTYPQQSNSIQPSPTTSFSQVYPQPSTSIQQSYPGFSGFINSRFQKDQDVQQPFISPQTLSQQQPVNQPRPQPVNQPNQLVAEPAVVQSGPATTISQICGTAAVVPRPLVVGGQTIEKGSWPWLVAVYLNDARGLSFKCGGNLITSRTVITAAHCLKLRGVEYKSKNVLIIAGRHNLLDWSESTSLTYNVERITIHPDYKDSLTSFDGDVAIIIVKQTIRFNDHIRPVCLWYEDSDLHRIEGQKGVVVGWGKDENRDVSPEPKKVTTTIVSAETCLRSNDRFSQITSERTFCAGNLNGEGPCTGDSGGGLMIERNGRWTLRGTVSGALAEANSENCDLKQYVIYSDIAKFTSWIYSNMAY